MVKKMVKKQSTIDREKARATVRKLAGLHPVGLTRE